MSEYDRIRLCNSPGMLMIRAELGVQSIIDAFELLVRWKIDDDSRNGQSPKEGHTVFYISR